jgi:hypothetical protein
MTSVVIPPIGVVHGPIRARRRRGIAASRDSTTTGRRPISEGAEFHPTASRRIDGVRATPYVQGLQREVEMRRVIL